MTTEAAPNSKLTLQGFVGLMGVFFGLCTIFALLVTAAEAWQEHRQAQWPEATARIQRCSVETHYSQRREYVQIECRISYLVGNEEIVTHVRSRSTASSRRALWEYPAEQAGRMQEWVDAHRQGALTAVHYDPANHKNAALVATDMPLGGPRTPSNLKLLTIAAIACAVFLTIARLMRGQTSIAGSATRT